MKESKRILLVEDDVDDQVYFLDAIAEINPSIECKIANNGLEALQNVQSTPSYDVIFLDLNMPIMNGFEFLNSFKTSKRKEDIPVVIFTTSKNPNDIQRTKELGASLFFTKPNNFKVLCDKLIQVFNTHFPTTSFVI